MRFVFFYLMSDHPGVAEVAPRHAEYWQELSLPGYLGGPFADRSGGLIIFECGTPAQAQQLVGDDPFIRAGSLSTWWLEPWLPAQAASGTSQADRH